MLDADQHPAAVDGGGLQTHDLANPHPGAVGRGQRDPVAQAGNRLEELHDLLAAQHHRQPLRLTGGHNPLECISPAHGHTKEKT